MYFQTRHEIKTNLIGVTQSACILQANLLRKENFTAAKSTFT